MDLSETSTATRDQAIEALLGLGEAGRETMDEAYQALAVGDYDAVVELQGRQAERDAALAEAREIWQARQRALARKRAGRGLEG
jgi:predicted kinase